MDELAQRAVRAALRGDWKEAKTLNEALLKLEEDKADTLCRLARAYLELGKQTKALSTYKKVLSVDPYNLIAQKAVDRLEKLKDSKNHTNNHNSHTASPTAFLEEPGKTKTATLIHMGSSEVVATLSVGQEVKLVPGVHRVSVETPDGDFIGRLPDDLSRRIISLSKAGTQYETIIRSTSPQVRVFIREVARGTSVCDIPSFPATEKSDYATFTPPDLVYSERPETESFEEETALE